jgi:hypothetical protein
LPDEWLLGGVRLRRPLDLDELERPLGLSRRRWVRDAGGERLVKWRESEAAPNLAPKLLLTGASGAQSAASDTHRRPLVLASLEGSPSLAVWCPFRSKVGGDASRRVREGGHTRARLIMRAHE